MTFLYRVRTAITGYNGGAQLSTHYLDATSPGTAQDAADAVHTFWSTAAAKIANSYQFQVQPLVEIIQSTTGQITGASATSSTIITGSITGNLAAPTNQALVRWHTGVYQNGREIRGRTFIPGMPAAGVDNVGTLDGGYQTTYNSAAAAYLSWTSSTPVIYSRQHFAFAPVVSGDTWKEIAVLRSRRD